LIRFTNAQEFIDELEKDRAHIKRKIVRLTTLEIPYGYFPAHFERLVATAELEWGDIIKMEIDHPSDELYGQVVEACKRLDLEVRGGMYQERGS